MRSIHALSAMIALGIFCSLANGQSLMPADGSAVYPSLPRQNAHPVAAPANNGYQAPQQNFDMPVRIAPPSEFQQSYPESNSNRHVAPPQNFPQTYVAPNSNNYVAPQPNRYTAPNRHLAPYGQSVQQQILPPQQNSVTPPSSDRWPSAVAPNSAQQASPSPSDVPVPNTAQPQSGNYDGAYNSGDKYSNETYSDGGKYGSCDDCGDLSCGGCCCPWFGGVSSIFITRGDEDPLWLSYDTANSSGSLLGSHDSRMDWTPGAEIHIGYNFGMASDPCGCDPSGGVCGVEAVYWGIYPEMQEALAYDPGAGALNSTIDFTGLNYDDGGGAAGLGTFYDGSFAHRLRRSFEFHNFELNLINRNLASGGWFNVDWLAGFRYMKMDEGFEFATDNVNTTFTGTADEVYYGIDVENHLYGFQVGGRGDWHFCHNLSFNIDTKFGLFGNHMNHRSRIAGGTGTLATINNGVNSGRAFDVSSDEDDIAFLGELKLGLSWRFCQCASATIGYRMVSVNGVAQATDQVPQFLEDLDGIADINNDASLLLHGGYAGIEFSY